MTGDQHENVPNPEGSLDTEKSSVGSGRGVVVRQTGSAQRILDKVLGRDRVEADARTAVDDTARALPTEVRRVRRGKFFLSNYEQEQFGSLYRPIFQHYCHGVNVGETQPDPDRDGVWCFAAHNDFDLIPEFQPPSTWPEYVRTHSGWKKAEDKQSEASTARVDYLLQRVQEIKRLL